MLDPVKFWDKCVSSFAHLDDRDYISFYKKYVTSYLDFNEKCVIDYGIGKGHLGKMLLEHYGIIEYIGIDISSRQLTEAAKNLGFHKAKCTFLQTPVDLSSLDADIFVSIACVQHFPSANVLSDFLGNVNSSGIPRIVLQFRDAAYTVFRPGNYTDIKEVTLSCCTHVKDIVEPLCRYKLLVDEYNPTNKYRYVTMELK